MCKEHAALFFWNELTTEDFKTLDADRTIAILPVAATEQHGPHLPVSTDTAINAGMISVLREMIPDDLTVLVLPIQEIGRSLEHIARPGTVTQLATRLVDDWFEIGNAVARAGIRKLVIVNSHGGNWPVIDIVARELRVAHNMLVATTQWNRFGTPSGMFSAEELRYGIHAGAVETSLMLHFRPELVRLDKAMDFKSFAAEMEGEYKYLRPTAPHAFGWIVGDINPFGAVGNALDGDAEKGRAVAQHQVAGFIELLRDVTKFPISHFDRQGDVSAPARERLAAE